MKQYVVTSTIVLSRFIVYVEGAVYTLSENSTCKTNAAEKNGTPWNVNLANSSRDSRILSKITQSQVKIHYSNANAIFT